MKVAQRLVWAAVLIWAIWTGGQVYHAMMVVPIWSVDPATSIPRYTQLSRDAATQPFFMWFSTLWPALLTGIAIILTRKLPIAARSSLALFAAGAFLISGVLILWMVPAIWGVIREAAPSSEAVQTFRIWESANRVRLVAELVLLPVAIRGLIGMYSPCGVSKQQSGAG